MMTAKNFVALADALANAATLEDAVMNIACVCKADNPRFKRDQFLAHIRDGREQVGE
jgi:hypothetical protein